MDERTSLSYRRGGRNVGGSGGSRSGIGTIRGSVLRRHVGRDGIGGGLRRII